MTTLVILIVTLVSRYHVFSIGYAFGSFSLLLLPLWVFCTLAETHRAPFDFSESESELVSGFNTEYSGAFFAFIFLTEYGVLLVGSRIIRFLFFGYLFSSFSISLLPLILSVASLRVSFIFV